MFTERRNIIISHHFSYFLHTVLFRFQQYTRTTHTYSPDKFYNRIVRTLLHFSVKELANSYLIPMQASSH